MTVYGEVIGHRFWGVIRHNGETRLRPYWVDLPWTGFVQEAICADRQGNPRTTDGTCADGGPVPSLAHNCGMHGVWLETENKWESGSHKNGVPVFGTVAAWGRVIPGKLGFRAQFVSVNSLEAPRCTTWQCEEAGDVVEWFGDLRNKPTKAQRYEPVYETFRGLWVTEDAIRDGAYPQSVRCAKHAHVDDWVEVPYGAKLGRRCEWTGCTLAIRLRYGGYGRDFCKLHAPLVTPVAAMMQNLSRVYDVPLTTAAESLPVKELDDPQPGT